LSGFIKKRLQFPRWVSSVRITAVIFPFRVRSCRQSIIARAAGQGKKIPGKSREFFWFLFFHL